MAVCAKCGSDDIRLSYNEAKVYGVTCTSSSHSKEHAEHLHYFCQRCRYDWTGPLTPVPARGEAVV